jgi:hypothetical protein
MLVAPTKNRPHLFGVEGNQTRVDGVELGITHLPILLCVLGHKMAVGRRHNSRLWKYIHSYDLRCWVFCGEFGCPYTTSRANIEYPADWFDYWGIQKTAIQ